ncbi:MAG: hypothetical protein QME44_01740 [Thermodesulfobacteriota bacterium]|nr:hypothetical protein [Thermodesulfobacteriota bacterium]
MPTFDSTAAHGTVSGGTPGGIKYEQDGELFKADGTHLGEATALPAAATINLELAPNIAHITGTANITSLGTPSKAGIVKIVIFDEADSVIVHGAATIVLPDSQNIFTEAGDKVTFMSDIVNNTLCWQCVNYLPLISYK